MSSEHFSSPSLNTDPIGPSHTADSSLQSGTVHAVVHQSSSNCSLDSSQSAYLNNASRHWPAPAAWSSQVLKRAEPGDYWQSTHQGRPTSEPSFISSQIPSETPVPVNISSDQSLVSTAYTLGNQTPLPPFNGANSRYSHPTHDLSAAGPTLHYQPTSAPAHCPPAPRYGRTSKQGPILTSRTSVQCITGLNCVQPVMVSSYADVTSSRALSDAPSVPSKLHSTSLPTSGDSRDDPIVLQDSPKAGAARVGAPKRSFQRTPPMAYNGSRSLKISPKMMGKATRTSPRTTLNSGGRSIISVPAPFKDRYLWMSEGRAANELQQANDASSHRASKPTINKRKRSAQADLSGQSSSSLLKKKSDQNSSSQIEYCQQSDTLSRVVKPTALSRWIFCLAYPNCNGKAKTFSNLQRHERHCQRAQKSFRDHLGMSQNETSPLPPPSSAVRNDNSIAAPSLRKRQRLDTTATLATPVNAPVTAAPDLGISSFSFTPPPPIMPISESNTTAVVVFSQPPDTEQQQREEEIISKALFSDDEDDCSTGIDELATEPRESATPAPTAFGSDHAEEECEDPKKDAGADGVEEEEDFLLAALENENERNARAQDEEGESDDEDFLLAALQEE